MPTATFPIQTYTVRVARNTATPFGQLTITGPVLTHGIQHRATLYFFPSQSQLGGSAFNIGGLNFNGVTVYALLPWADFDRIYDLVRSESPLHLYYGYATGTSTTRSLTVVAINTGEEPPGEGPADADAVDSLLRSMLQAAPEEEVEGAAT